MMSETDDKLLDENEARNILLLTNLAKTPVNVAGVQTNATLSVNKPTLQKYIDSTVFQSVTVEDLVNDADKLTSKLVRHGLVANALHSFHSPERSLQPSDSNPYPSIEVYDQLVCSPVKKFLTKTGTSIGNNEGEGHLDFKLRNLFGNGESLSLNLLKGTKVHSSYLLTFQRPLNPYYIFDISLAKNSMSMGNACPMEVLTQSAKFNIQTDIEPLEKGFKSYQNFFLEKMYRSSSITSKNAADAYLFQAGDDSKETIGHSISFDSRDMMTTPTTGSLLRISNELALKKFVKSQLEIVKAKSFFTKDFITTIATLRAGYIKNISSDYYPVHLSDKFHIGGVNDVRSFQSSGLGPRDLNQSIGGDTFLSYGLSLFSRLPYQKWTDSNFRLHYYLNGGKSINHNDSTLKQTYRRLLENPSISMGIGILYKHPSARFELNFGVPIACHPTDIFSKGFQFGVGVSFL